MTQENRYSLFGEREAANGLASGGEGLLAGMTDMSQALLGIALVPKKVPTPEEMAKAREAVLMSKTVKLKEFRVQLFDLSNEVERTAYEDLIELLYEKTQLREIQVTTHDRRFVELPTPKWLVMLQWFELELAVKIHPAVVPIGDTEHGKGSPGN